MYLPGNRQLALALEPLAQRLARHHGHHIVEKSVGVTRVEERKNVRMLQPRRGLDLGEESIGAENCTEFRMQQLDGDVAVVLVIVREVHGRHVPRAELTLDAIAAGECGCEAKQGIAAQGLAGMGRVARRAVAPSRTSRLGIRSSRDVSLGKIRQR